MTRLLLVAAVVGMVTGVAAVGGHIVAVVTHAVGGVVALACVGVAARHAWDHKLSSLIGGMVIANLTGVAWTAYGTAVAVVIAHVITGVAASAGALIIASDRLNSSDPDTYN